MVRSGVWAQRAMRGSIEKLFAYLRTLRFRCGSICGSSSSDKDFESSDSWRSWNDSALLPYRCVCIVPELSFVCLPFVYLFDFIRRRPKIWFTRVCTVVHWLGDLAATILSDFIVNTLYYFHCVSPIKHMPLLSFSSQCARFPVADDTKFDCCIRVLLFCLHVGTWLRRPLDRWAVNRLAAYLLSKFIRLRTSDALASRNGWCLSRIIKRKKKFERHSQQQLLM